MAPSKIASTLACLAVLVGVAGAALAQGKKSDSVVKVQATADKPGADGKQVVTITLNVDASYHIYANPVGNEDLTESKTVVSISGKEVKPEDVKVDYPAGMVVKDKDVGDYKTYEDKVIIKAHVQRAKGDTGPLEVSVKFQACTSKTCLLPATVKISVP